MISIIFVGSTLLRSEKSTDHLAKDKKLKKQTIRSLIPPVYSFIKLIFFVKGISGPKSMQGARLLQLPAPSSNQ